MLGPTIFVVHFARPAVYLFGVAHRCTMLNIYCKWLGTPSSFNLHGFVGPSRESIGGAQGKVALATYFSPSLPTVSSLLTTPLYNRPN